MFDGLSKVHKCKRRQTDDRPRYWEMCSCRRNRLHWCDFA